MSTSPAIFWGAITTRVCPGDATTELIDMAFSIRGSNITFWAILSEISWMIFWEGKHFSHIAKCTCSPLTFSTFVDGFFCLFFWQEKWGKIPSCRWLFKSYDSLWKLIRNPKPIFFPYYTYHLWLNFIDKYIFLT